MRQKQYHAKVQDFAVKNGCDVSRSIIREIKITDCLKTVKQMSGTDRIRLN